MQEQQERGSSAGTCPLAGSCATDGFGVTLNQASRLAIITLLFRDAGVVSPLAETALVKLYRGDELKVGPSEYAMVENINDIENHNRRKIRTLSRNTLDPHGL